MKRSMLLVALILWIIPLPAFSIAGTNPFAGTWKNIDPGRKYSYKATIDPKDWNMAPGVYRLEIAVDPQNNCHEPEALRADNVKTVKFRVQ